MTSLLWNQCSSRYHLGWGQAEIALQRNEVSSRFLGRQLGLLVYGRDERRRMT